MSAAERAAALLRSLIGHHVEPETTAWIVLTNALRWDADATEAAAIVRALADVVDEYRKGDR